MGTTTDTGTDMTALAEQPTEQQPTAQDTDEAPYYQPLAEAIQQLGIDAQAAR